MGSGGGARPMAAPRTAVDIEALSLRIVFGVLAAIAMVFLIGPTIVVILTSFTPSASLMQLAPALLDASQSLGAGGVMTFRRVTLPLIAPGVASGAFLAFMASFDNVPVSLFLSDERTEMLPIHLWQQIDTNLDVRTAAVSGLIVILTLVLMLIAERMAGLTRQIR